ncbi:hypothetical protein MTR67_048278 [Solanum verrucosum]|uniref:Uncharacterized protein n=1 Tax=Solanum verrucosum TaxID=315347 RepID=A0AAF0UXN4_SOLVR|nr:hypothetical protein MTR67_048278 [Solanum verrucosum]
MPIQSVIRPLVWFITVLLLSSVSSRFESLGDELQLRGIVWRRADCSFSSTT